MDNLYLASKFTHFCFSSLKQIMVHGVIHSEGRGVPKCVMQEKKTKKEEIQSAQGTVKAALLKNDSRCSGMVMLSYYDSKSVYLSTNAYEKIVWTEKKRKVHSKLLGKTAKYC